MHARGPGEQLAVPVLIQVPGFGHLVEGLQRLGFDPCGLLHVDVITLHQEAQRAIANVLVVMAAQRVVEHAFTQRAFGVGHAADLEGIEDRLQNRQARREYSAAVRLTPSMSIFSTSPSEQLALEPADTFGVDLTGAETTALDRQPDGANGAGRADGFLPAKPAQAVFDTHQFDACRRVGLGVARRGDLAVAEEALGIAHAAHLQAFTQLRLEAFADDELGAAAADVGDQAPA